MMYQAARALASSVTEHELDAGLIFPDLSNIRAVSQQIAEAGM
jgi:malic enzyme